jgi:hypothetical protein
MDLLSEEEKRNYQRTSSSQVRSLFDCFLIILLCLVSRCSGKDIRSGLHQDSADVSEAGYLTIVLESSPNYLDNPQDNIAQDDYHIWAPKVCREGALSPDDGLSKLSSPHEGPAPQQDDYGKYLGSSLMVRGNRKSQEQAAIFNHPWDHADQHYPKPSKSPDLALAINGNAAEFQKDIDSHQKLTGNKNAEVQSDTQLLSPVKQQPSHSKLAIRSILKPKPQNSQHTLDGTPYANPTKEATKTHVEHINHFRALKEPDEASVWRKCQHSGQLDAPSSALAIAHPNLRLPMPS